MTRYGYFLLLQPVPQDQAAANGLSQALTAHYGNLGWQLVGITSVGDGSSIVLSFQKEATSQPLGDAKLLDSFTMPVDHIAKASKRKRRKRKNQG